MRKIWDLLKDIYDPFVHLYYSLNWCLALFFSWLSLYSIEMKFHFDVFKILFIDILILFFVLFYLRLIDEIKDFTYDQEFNPDRPLVLGSYSKKDFLVMSVFCLIISLALSAFLGLYEFLFILIHFLYSLMLWPLETKLPLVKESVMLNLIVTYPVNIALSVFLILSYNSQLLGSYMLNTQDAWVVLIFALAFLYYEFSRKIDFKSKFKDKLYSTHLGLWPSVGLNIVWGVGTAVGVFYLFEAWSAALLFLPIVWGVFRLKEKVAYPFKLTGSVFLGLYYGLMIALGVLKLF